MFLDWEVTLVLYWNPHESSNFRKEKWSWGKRRGPTIGPSVRFSGSSNNVAACCPHREHRRESLKCWSHGWARGAVAWYMLNKMNKPGREVDQVPDHGHCDKRQNHLQRPRWESSASRRKRRVCWLHRASLSVYQDVARFDNMFCSFSQLN